MNHTDEKFKNIEKEYVDVMQNKLHTLCTSTADAISTTKSNFNVIGINYDLPNIGITINNKVNELANQFKKADISLYVKEVASIEDPDRSYIIPSTIGTAIASDLLSYCNVATAELRKCSDTVLSIANRKNEKITALTQLSPFKRFLSTLRSRFIPNKNMEKNKCYTKEELNSINENLSRFMSSNDYIENYTLRKDLVSSLTQFINHTNYPIVDIQNLLESDIAPDLEALGLSDLMPELNNSLVNQINAKNFIIKKKINHEQAKEAAEAKSKELEEEGLDKF